MHTYVLSKTNYITVLSELFLRNHVTLNTVTRVLNSGTRKYSMLKRDRTQSKLSRKLWPLCYLMQKLMLIYCFKSEVNSFSTF